MLGRVGIAKLPRKTRSMLNLDDLILSRSIAGAQQGRAANGVTRREIFMQVAIYAGVPRRRQLRIAREVFANDEG